MSHTSIASTRDYIPGRDKGDLTDPAQAASFVSDPLLTPITTSAMPKPMLPDPTPSENPEMFDKSTNHPNTHYHPDAKLSKKKRAKKLGTGYIAMPHGGAHGSGGVHAGGRTFSEHEKEAHERAERRDAAIGAASQEHEEEWETDEDDEAQEAEQSHRQSHENRITGTEASGRSQPAAKRNEDVVDSLKGNKDDKEGGKDSQEKGKEGGADDEQSGDKDKSDNPSLLQRASGVLSSAQQKATGMAAGVTSSVMSTAQSVPLVGSLLSKMGLGASKDDKAGNDSSSGDKQGEEGEQGADEQQEGAGGSGSASNSKSGSKVGGNREAETEGITKGAGSQSTTEAATKGGSEKYDKEAARQDNHEGALDKSRSHAGQKQADNMRAVNQQAKKEEEA